MRRILSEPVQGCRSSGDSAGMGRVVQLLKLNEFRSPHTRSVYRRGFDEDFVDTDHSSDKTREKGTPVRS